MNLRRHLMLITAIPIVALSFVASLALRFDSALPRSELHNLYSGLAPEDLAFGMTQLQTRVWAGDPEREKSHLLEFVPKYLGAKPVTRIDCIGDREREGVCA